MAIKYFDRVKELSTTAGTGAFTLSGADSGFVAFSSVLSVADTFYYCIQSKTPGEWETGIGTYSAANTLTRTTPLAGSAATPVNFSAGDKDVFITVAAALFSVLPVKASGAEVTTGTDDAKFATPKALSDAGIVAVTLPVKATGAEVTTGTDDAKFATPKALSDAGIVAVTLPVKATGAEVTTGTDDAKFATPKALNDAGIVAVTLPVKATGAEVTTGTDDAKFATPKALNDAGIVNKPTFSAHKNNVDQTGVVTATFTKVTATTEEWDIGSCYDAANSKWIPNIAGYCNLKGTLLFTANADQSATLLAIYKNGSLYKTGALIRGSGTGNHGVSVDAIAYANGTTDYFELYAYQASASNKTISGLVEYTYFQGAMI
jgi:hypothetical protein